MGLILRALKSMPKPMTLIELTEKSRHEIFQRRMRIAFDEQEKGIGEKMTGYSSSAGQTMGQTDKGPTVDPDIEARELFQQVGGSVADLLTQKRISYGDSYSLSTHILALLYPHGITTLDYGNLLAILRIVEKLFRAAKSSDPDGESPFFDIAGYAMLVLATEERDKPLKT